MATTTPRVPRINFPGSWAAGLNKALEVWADLIERSLRVTGVYPLSVTRDAVGMTIRMAPIVAIVPATASSSIPAGTVTAPGQGTATVYQMTADGGTPVSLAITVKVWNIHDKTVANTAGLILGYDGASYWVISVDSCTHLS